MKTLSPDELLSAAQAARMASIAEATPPASFAAHYRPMQDRLLVRRLEAASEQGGIYIPEQHRERPCWGEVVSVGTGRMTDAGAVVPVAVGLGTRVLFGKFSGTEIKIDGVEYLILREDEILLSVAPQ